MPVENACRKCLHLLNSQNEYLKVVAQALKVLNRPSFLKFLKITSNSTFAQITDSTCRIKNEWFLPTTKRTTIPNHHSVKNQIKE
jgi:hypothetical protein